MDEIRGLGLALSLRRRSFNERDRSGVEATRHTAAPRQAGRDHGRLNMQVLNKPEVLNRESAAKFDAEGRLETA